MNRLLWKIYAGFFVLLTGVSLMMAFSVKGVIWMEYAPRVVIMLLSVTGLCGFAWKKPFGKAWFWRVVFLSLVLTLVWVRLRGFHVAEGQDYSVAEDVFRYAIGIASIAPLFYGLFSYAYRSPEIWSEKSE